MNPASFRPSERPVATWKITAGCMLLSLILHALLFELFTGFAVLRAPVGPTLLVDRWKPAPPARPTPPMNPAPAAPFKASPPAPLAAEPPSPPPPRPRTQPVDPPAVKPPPPKPPATRPTPAAAPVRPPTPASAAAPASQRVPAPTPAEEVTPPPTPVPDRALPSQVEASVDPGTGDPRAPDETAESFQPPAYLRTPKPDYPGLAKKRRWEGTVLLKVFIDETGRVERAEIDRSSGHALLDQAALRQIRIWSFRPARRGGLAVGSQALVPVEFVLEGS